MSVIPTPKPSYLEMLPAEMIQERASYLDLKSQLSLMQCSIRLKHTVCTAQRYQALAQEHAADLENYHLSAVTGKPHRGSQLSSMREERSYRLWKGVCPPCEYWQGPGCVSLPFRQAPASRIMIDILNGDLKYIRSYLNAGVNPNGLSHSTRDCITRLSYEISRTGDIELFKLALERQADINGNRVGVAEDYGVEYILDLLDHSFYENKEENVEFLLENGANCSRTTILFRVFRLKSAVKILELLLKNGVDLTRLTNLGTSLWFVGEPGRAQQPTVINICAPVGTPDLLEFLISRVPEYLNDVTGALWPAIYAVNDKPDNFLYLLHRGGEPDTDLLQVAVEHRDNGEDGWAQAVQAITSNLQENSKA
ncbi:hypothetical protein ASPCADRAFT_8930 [Aspergillus carbonarius ITEM 5010]|uniref:F-box domain-containing protein n=1 Tax=Aspergillus carbonarius (strain ITEM 5010) TaxID=602072 RepID=A0A1R3RC82_ASPC5|nr:hypothetical protein ASPCADRAFT_8930 [Aspergillus carbonarius ITEM 5010]